VVDSTVNHCHYESDTTMIQMAMSGEIKGLCFYAWFVRQIIDSNGCTFAFSEYNTKYVYFQWTRKSSCSKNILPQKHLCCKAVIERPKDVISLWGQEENYTS